MKTGRIFLFALLAATPLSTRAAPAAGTIEVMVTGIRSTDGVVRVEICPKATFLGKCPWKGEMPARPEGVTILIRGVPPGAYAIQAFHDRNDNGLLDRRIFGIPREDVGFSRIRRLPMRAPRFDDAEFTHGAADQRVPVVLSYYF